MQIDERTLQTFGDSLGRCNGNPAFIERFYEIFLASSPKVKEKFARTDFVRQRAALRASLDHMLLAAKDPKANPQQYLHDLSERHSSRQLNIGAELYDLWLDSLLATVKEFDPQNSPDVQEAWEKVMMAGISYLLSRY
ncbi:MAG: globin [Acidobacteriia bacterium]|nr:globin [Terriglobia bacterium]